MSSQIDGRYHGQGGPLFALYVKTALLTVLTLGIYRFWAKTRIRKHIWSATEGDGDSFEYTGTGLEKLLGFLLAVVILAVYLGIVQMILFFFGIFLFEEPETQAQVLVQMAGIYITVLAVVPLIFFAQYRARRYRMARTRWRGLRFGMEHGAWGYAGRAILYLILTILTLGILLPRQTFLLEKYMTDRTWYGNGRFVQGGKWTALYPGMKHLAIALAVLIGSAIVALLLQSGTLAVLGSTVGYVWLAVGFVHYRVFSFNYLTRHKILDGEVSFEASARTGQIVKIYVIGGLCTLGVGLVFAFLISILFAGFMPFMLDPGAAGSGAISGGAGIGFFIAMIVLYGGFFLILGGISLVMIVQRSIEHFVTSVIVGNADHLETVRQRTGDAGADAEGFADALDVGGAI